MAEPTWTTALPDWEERIVEGRSLIPVGALFAAEAAAAMAVFERLQVTDLPAKGNGTFPTLGEVCDPWVFDFVRAIFGAYDQATGQRLIREFLLLIAKKNGKSTIAAGIMLTALVRNWRHGADLLILAPSKTIAENSFEPAAAMVRADGELAALIHVVEHQRKLVHRTTNATLKVIAADSDVLGGTKAGFVLVEELWLFGKKPKAKAMLGEALGGLAARPEGFIIYLSTHSDEMPAGVWREKLDYARGVRDGAIDDRQFLPVLYEFPAAMLEAEAYLDPANFGVTNPSLGAAKSEDWLKRELKREQDGDGEGLQLFLAKHLNVEIGQRLRQDRWRGADLWEACGDRRLAGDAGLDELLRRSEVAVVGVDGGGLDDLLGLCVAGRELGTGRWLYWFRAWAWSKVLERRKDIASLLRDFEKDGDLVILDEPDFDEAGEDGPVQADGDIVQVMEIIERVGASGRMPAKGAIGLDPGGGIGMLIDALEAAGFGERMDGVRQGFALASAVWTLERKLNSRSAVHDGSALMRWCVSNARTERGRYGVAVSKAMSGSGKIDPFTAGLNATKLLETGPEAANDSDAELGAWLASHKGHRSEAA